VNPLGHTRTTVRPNHALIAPDSHVLAPLPDWERTRGVILISPAMGAHFVQYLALLEPGSSTVAAPAGIERFIYVLDGEVSIERRSLNAGGYAFFPAGHAHHLSSKSTGRALVFEKAFVPADGAKPQAVIGHESEIASTPFMGDPDAQLKLLLPDMPAFDLAINIFTYNPGAMLPQVECHVMEHGLLMLQGMGVYRLNDQWYPVEAGDVIWMAAYCPQWFIAGGKTPARYIYYKDVNRAPIGGAPR
jgi:(S)-ureidoglycine aminohydrolase